MGKGSLDSSFLRKCSTGVELIRSGDTKFPFAKAISNMISAARIEQDTPFTPSF